jgi:regulator of cell morphogenesis and NO signaling
MYQTRKTHVKPDLKMSDLIFENSSLLIMMEHFGLYMATQDKSVEQICRENQISQEVFVAITNLYNGFNPGKVDLFHHEDAKEIISFLEKSHQYYLNDKIPEIHEIINHMFSLNDQTVIILVEDFFREYSKEVEEHLAYEDDIAFPYFRELLEKGNYPGTTETKFSVAEYREHHTDIETKLADLKTLLVKHVSLRNQYTGKRKLLFSLFELEYDLNIHSMIEEIMLMPLIRKIEKKVPRE